MGFHFYTYPQLREHGIRYSRRHIRRLEKLKLFPMHFNLDSEGRRIAWEATLIDRYQAEKDKKARRNAKAAREASNPERKADKAEQERRVARRDPRQRALPEIGGPNDDA